MLTKYEHKSRMRVARPRFGHPAVWHPCNGCPAKTEIYNFFEKVGHCAKCCIKHKHFLSCVDEPCLALIGALRFTFSEYVLAEITVNNISAQSLVDNGNSYLSCICKE